MNNKNSTSPCAIFLVAALLVAAASAQDTNPSGPAPVPAPTDPIIQSPDIAAWTLKVTPSAGMVSAAKAGDRFILRADVVKTGNLRHEVDRWNDGATSELWIVDGRRFTETEGTVAMVHPIFVGDKPIAEPQKLTFDDLGWVGKNNYKGVIKLAGHDSYYFKVGSQEAWIDVKTRLPLTYRDEFGTKVYEFGTAPSAMLVLPSNYQALIEGYAKEAQQAIDRFKGLR